MAREMKDSGVDLVGKIPFEWVMKPIKAIASYNDETLNETTDEYFEFDYIDIGSVQYGKGITQYQRMKFKDAPSRARRIVRCNDTIVSTVRTYLKAIAKIDDSDFPQVASTGFVVIRAKEILPLFLYYALLSEAFICAVESHSTGISYPAINGSDVVRLKIPIPPSDEQKRICIFLDNKCAEIDTVLEKTRTSIEEYKKLKQAIITQAVTKGVRGDRPMRESGIECIPMIPADWSSFRGKHLFYETNERSETGSEELLTVSHKTGITPRSQKNVNMFMSESLVGYKICREGDIAANTMWMWQGAIGVSAYHGVISPSYNTYRQRNGVFDFQYLDYLLRIQPLVEQYKVCSTGITASRLRLYPEQFLSIKFVVPPMEEQQEIVKFLHSRVDEMDTIIQKKEQFLTELENYKKSLIYEYVTGKKGV